LSIRNLLIQGLKFKKTKNNLAKILTVWAKGNLFKQKFNKKVVEKGTKNVFPFSNTLLNTFEIFLNFAILGSAKKFAKNSGYLRITQNNKFAKTLKI